MDFIKITCIRVKIENLSRNEKKSILKKIQKLGWLAINEPNKEDIHTIDRRIGQYEYLDNGEQNLAIHTWQPLEELGIKVEYAGYAY